VTDLEPGLDDVATGDDLAVHVPFEVGVEAGLFLGDTDRRQQVGRELGFGSDG
jgi:hypothetical protein